MINNHKKKKKTSKPFTQDKKELNVLIEKNFPKIIKNKKRREDRKKAPTFSGNTEIQ